LAGIFFASFLLRKSGSSPCILFFDNFGGLSFTTNGHLVGFGGNEVGRSLPWISLEVYEIPVLLGRIYSSGGGLHLGRAKISTTGGFWKSFVWTQNSKVFLQINYLLTGVSGSKRRSQLGLG
jgi:hypothetical protein